MTDGGTEARETPRRFEGGRLVVASHNAGKVREIRDLLAPYGVETVSAADLDLPVPDETETTFEGNARIKATAAATAADLPALADDSGLAIEALDGAPGVYTADWAETPTGRDFSMAMAKVNALLNERAAPEPRRARFVSVLCLAWPDGHTETVRGEVAGSIVWPPRGSFGHGYDPIFVRDGETETFAELDTVAKNADSHRANAFRALVAQCFARSAPRQKGDADMTRRTLSTGSPMEAAFGYSRAVVQETPAGRWCWVAGTTGYDYERMVMPDDPADQARQALATVAETLAEERFAMSDIVRVRYYLTHVDFIEEVAAPLVEAFGDIRPAATMIIADLIKPEMHFEIEVDAFQSP